ncbi:hypothetical protein GCM10020000_56650 [Streptomyces olivoverticillatus]
MRVTGRLLSGTTKGDVNELKRTIAEYLDQIGPALAEKLADMTVAVRVRPITDDSNVR